MLRNKDAAEKFCNGDNKTKCCKPNISFSFFQFIFILNQINSVTQLFKYLCMAKSKASAATVFSPPDKLSIGRNLKRRHNSLRLIHSSPIKGNQKSAMD